MTNERYIAYLTEWLEDEDASLEDFEREVLTAALKALEHEQALGEAFNIALLYGKEKGMEAIDKALYQMGMDGIKEQEIKALEQEQEPKTGHWIWNNSLFNSWTCSECKLDNDKETDYCPNCGAKMVEPQESEGSQVEGITPTVINNGSDMLSAEEIDNLLQALAEGKSEDKK